ncbi:nucleoside hydrolase [Sedimentibacter sp. zth1]|uniref:nucleoside hydrolase n=1 Tax=Sedimentibacter sp. zth1 TaxID=2816908 RepID=UPI001A91746E|nr:nucleoside hydrolase [Sedimentibacter sp. zth1]QSX04944.1 nucleoside hydrolase [Sedimentibacter sp. zth1]
MKKNIIIDCDPGIDDAVAITLAIANEDKLNILGITTVTGNQSIEKVTNNALKLVSFLNRDIKVAKGVDMPLIREKHVAEGVHGTTGMGNYALPETNSTVVKENAVEFLKNTILNSKDKITLVPIGPLTNIALLFKVYPEVKENIDEIVLMGGAINGGNITSTGEFNIWADPEAAQIVFKSGVKIVMNGLDVTHSTGLYMNDVQELLKSDKKVSNMCGQILEFYFRGDHVKEHTFTPIHDASAIMYLIHEELYNYRYMPVNVDLSESFNRGMTVGDNREWIKYDETYPKVLMGVDTEKFRQYLLESIYKLDEEIK